MCCSRPCPYATGKCTFVCSRIWSMPMGSRRSLKTVLTEVKGRADIITLFPKRILTAAEKNMRNFHKKAHSPELCPACLAAACRLPSALETCMHGNIQHACMATQHSPAGPGHGPIASPQARICIRRVSVEGLEEGRQQRPDPLLSQRPCCDLPGEGSTERSGTPSRSINTLTNLAGWQTCRPSEETGQGRQRSAVIGT